MIPDLDHDLIRERLDTLRAEARLSFELRMSRRPSWRRRCALLLVRLAVLFEPELMRMPKTT